MALGVSGASGAVLALRLAEAALAAEWEIELVCSRYGRLMWGHELGRPIEQDIKSLQEAGSVRVHKSADLAAPLASGSYPIDAYAIVPASMATVAALATGLGTNLLQRMGDVAIKERRRMVLVPRECPLSPIHLTNLLRLAELGVTIAPPVPAFYELPTSLDEVINSHVERLLVWLGIRPQLPRERQWTAGESGIGRAERAGK